MSYTDVFGGATLYPVGQSYLSLVFATDQTLEWPLEQQSSNIVASIMDLSATVPGLNVILTDARQVSTGIQAVFNNVGANTYTVKDSVGGTIIAPAPGTAWVAYLTDNSTAAGSWRTFQLGATVSVASAAALAGAGIKAISTTLNQKIEPSSKASTPFTIVDADRAKGLIYTAGVGVANLTAAATLGSDWFVLLRNSGSGDLVVTPPAGLIDGSATKTVSPGESCIIFTDGANFYTVGFGQSSTSVFDYISIAVPGSGDYTLSGVELNRISYNFTGILTGNRNIVVPASVQQYWVSNQTTGAFTLSVKVAAQVGPPSILQTDRAILYCDGAQVVNASSSTVVFPISISQGGTGAITAAAAVTALGAVPTTRAITAGSGMAGGGDLSANRTLTLDINSLTTDTTPDFAADFVPTFDVSAAANKKVLLETIQPTTLKTLQDTDFSFSNQGTDQTITGLTQALLAAKNYLIEFAVRIVTASSGYSFSWDPPAGSGLTGFGSRAGSANPLQLASTGASDVIDSQTAAARDAWITGCVYYNPSSDGNLIFTVKQSTVDVNSAVVAGSSWSRATIVA